MFNINDNSEFEKVDKIKSYIIFYFLSIFLLILENGFLYHGVTTAEGFGGLLYFYAYVLSIPFGILLVFLIYNSICKVKTLPRYTYIYQFLFLILFIPSPVFLYLGLSQFVYILPFFFFIIATVIIVVVIKDFIKRK